MNIWLGIAAGVGWGLSVGLVIALLVALFKRAQAQPLAPEPERRGADNFMPPVETLPARSYRNP